VIPTPQVAGREVKAQRDNDGLHKRRGIWHYKLKISGKWKEVSAKTTNYQKARKARHDALEAQEKGQLPTDFAKLVFEKAKEAWLIERKATVAAKTHRIDKERSAALEVAFGGRRLCDITGDLVRAYQMKRVAKVSPRTVNLETKVLRMILKRARLWARMADEYKGLREDKRGPGRALSPEQEQKLFGGGIPYRVGSGVLCGLAGEQHDSKGLRTEGPETWRH